jgi:hypothetical protein
VRGVLEDWRTMGPTGPVRSASHAVLRQLRESTRQQKLRDKMGRFLAPALHYFKLVAGVRFENTLLYFGFSGVRAFCVVLLVLYEIFYTWSRRLYLEQLRERLGSDAGVASGYK